MPYFCVRMPRLTPFVYAVILGATACTSQGDVAVTTTATEPPAVSTTVPWATGAAVKAWSRHVKSFVVKDVSKVSKGECGVFAMLITEGSATFYWWDGAKWNDDSRQLTGVRGQMPEKVYSHDFTNDGVIDYFVTYSDNSARGGPVYGAFFAHKWSGEKMCDWDWVDVDDGRDLTKIVESPEVDQRKGLVYGTGYAKGRWKSFGLVDYLPSSGSFVFQAVTK